METLKDLAKILGGATSVLLVMAAFSTICWVWDVCFIGLILFLGWVLVNYINGYDLSKKGLVITVLVVIILITTGLLHRNLAHIEPEEVSLPSLSQAEEVKDEKIDEDKEEEKAEEVEETKKGLKKSKKSTDEELKKQVITTSFETSAPEKFDVVTTSEMGTRENPNAFEFESNEKEHQDTQNAIEEAQDNNDIIREGQDGIVVIEQNRPTTDETTDTPEEKTEEDINVDNTTSKDVDNKQEEQVTTEEIKPQDDADLDDMFDNTQKEETTENTEVKAEVEKTEAEDVVENTVVEEVVENTDAEGEVTSSDLTVELPSVEEKTEEIKPEPVVEEPTITVEPEKVIAPVSVNAIDGYTTTVGSSVQFQISGDEVSISGLDGIDHSFNGGILTVNVGAEATVLTVEASNSVNSVSFDIVVNGVVANN